MGSCRLASIPLWPVKQWSLPLPHASLHPDLSWRAADILPLITNTPKSLPVM